jgi:hypothetical protein
MFSLYSHYSGRQCRCGRRYKFSKTVGASSTESAVWKLVLRSLARHSTAFADSAGSKTLTVVVWILDGGI